MNIGDYPYFHVVTIIRKTNMSFFNNLPNELLIMIFNLCDVYTLSKISVVCRKFYEISYMILNKKTQHLLVTNQVSEKFRERDGSIRHWIIESPTEKNDVKHLRTHYNVHDDIRHIDATLRHIISGSSNSIKIQKYTYVNYEEYLKEKKQIVYNNECEVQSMLFDPTGTKFAVSIYTKNPEHLSSLLIYDIGDRDSVIDKTEDCSNYCYKPGAFQLLWEDPHTILMCYDSYIKKMDIRTSEFVRTWNSSSENNKKFTFFTTDKILTCFTTDNLYTIMTGTTNSQVLLWDQRQNAYIEEYRTCTHHSVISIEFDSSHLYTVTEKYLCEYDFQERFDFRERKYILSNFFK
ncbi:uncharacterized protein [Linepithema humile]|uniref:uncharacterized protein isoform X3 n=1 Tax=Linepithema humile TaxID=83485 RepID=UPI00351DEA82